MHALRVRIRRVLSTEAPVTVECMMTDYAGQMHYFHNRLSAFTAESDPMIPGDGLIRCTVRAEHPLFAEVSTELPDFIESTAGLTEFRVACSDLTDQA